ncbi:hypothetical protein B0A48_14868 [Cryoendolithus antarcticus]|uniref:Small ribosomal subunit protein mS23 n=1 Tax=Cryoendolithus antarcticus TaxID=1507870 RepID=A0A1V8SIY7_9PEZI|nr:hypothetical protein B0A48_14868 [Cryoendolithus antarcticus]
MGRYNLSAQRVHKHASQLLEANRISAPPPWYDTIATFPPSAILVRPIFQRPTVRKGIKKPSKLFSPVKLGYEEDRLRWEYFNDHPWELARPRVVLENDGRDHEKWDWSHALCQPETRDVGEAGVNAWMRMQQRSQASRPLNGEAVVQRQMWLMRHEDMSEAKAYDAARKELYRARHLQETEQRVAKEEALHYGAYFGKSPLEVGMQLEDAQWENWKAWAEKETTALKALQGSAYTGMEVDPALDAPEVAEEEVQELARDVPGSRAGKSARGGAAVHP